MKLAISAAALLATTSLAYANGAPTHDVPEISAVAGFAALGVVGAIAALIWERRR